MDTSETNFKKFTVETIKVDTNALMALNILLLNARSMEIPITQDLEHRLDSSCNLKRQKMEDSDTIMTFANSARMTEHSRKNALKSVAADDDEVNTFAPSYSYHNKLCRGNQDSVTIKTIGTSFEKYMMDEDSS
mgnify:CR=1 FL=1